LWGMEQEGKCKHVTRGERGYLVGVRIGQL
jgi:hypothetical protein